MIEPHTPPEPFNITSEYLDYLIGILTGTVTPKAGAEFIPVLEIARMAQLGAAWAEANEAAKGKWVTGLYETRDGDWAALVNGLATAFGATPTAALLALPAKLKEWP